jgi:hypothetical protein
MDDVSRGHEIGGRQAEAFSHRSIQASALADAPLSAHRRSRYRPMLCRFDALTGTKRPGRSWQLNILPRSRKGDDDPPDVRRRGACMSICAGIRRNLYCFSLWLQWRPDRLRGADESKRNDRSPSRPTLRLPRHGHLTFHRAKRHRSDKRSWPVREGKVHRPFHGSRPCAWIRRDYDGLPPLRTTIRRATVDAALTPKAVGSLAIQRQSGHSCRVTIPDGFIGVDDVEPPGQRR